MFIFMEYCGEGTIWNVAKQGLPEPMIRSYTKQILVAISVLHENGIVHRDVKGGGRFLGGEAFYILSIFQVSTSSYLPTVSSNWETSAVRSSCRI